MFQTFAITIANTLRITIIFDRFECIACFASLVFINLYIELLKSENSNLGFEGKNKFSDFSSKMMEILEYGGIGVVVSELSDRKGAKSTVRTQIYF